MDHNSGDVTALLTRWRRGDPEAESALLAVVQRELRKIALAYLSRERPGHSLQPTELVDEAYMRLIGRREFGWENRAHFYGIAAQVMRRVLVDHARKRRASKRDGLKGERVSISVVPDPQAADRVEVIALHEALTALARLDDRQADIVTMRYFGGLSVEEIAESRGISSATVKRELLTAKVWLRDHLAKHREKPSRR
jgi:RNA polymerase sigma factor (TIGR02999 family)